MSIHKLQKFENIKSHKKQCYTSNLHTYIIFLNVISFDPFIQIMMYKSTYIHSFITEKYKKLGILNYLFSFFFWNFKEKSMLELLKSKDWPQWSIRSGACIGRSRGPWEHADCCPICRNTDLALRQTRLADQWSEASRDGPSKRFRWENGLGDASPEKYFTV